jgi:1-acyl-sn-glycerol-3-phosphate acyltransferase
MSAALAFLRSVLFGLVFYPGSAIAVLLAFPLALLGRKAVRKQAVRWAAFHRWCARVFLGVESRVEGEIPCGPLIFASKHQSMYETLELLLMLRDPAVVVKRELTKIPFWGEIALKQGVIPVDREGSSGALRSMLKAARAAVTADRPILIFPEGTRVHPGERPPLRAGFAGLYRMLGLTVVPIALDSGRLWPRRAFIKRPGIVTFRFGEPIPPGLPRAEAEARVHEAINALEDDRSTPGS